MFHVVSWMQRVRFYDAAPFCDISRVWIRPRAAAVVELARVTHVATDLPRRRIALEAVALEDVTGRRARSTARAVLHHSGDPRKATLLGTRRCRGRPDTAQQRHTLLKSERSSVGREIGIEAWAHCCTIGTAVHACVECAVAAAQLVRPIHAAVVEMDAGSATGLEIVVHYMVLAATADQHTHVNFDETV